MELEAATEIINARQAEAQVAQSLLGEAAAALKSREKRSWLPQEASENVEKYINLISGQVYGPDCESENNFLCK
jgi:hypothetical protein